MDLSAILSTISTSRTLLNREHGSNTVSRSFRFLCYFPFLYLALSALYTVAFDRSGLQCQPGSFASEARYNSECWHESYTIPNIRTYAYSLHPGVGQVTAKSILRFRTELPYMSLSFILSTLVFLFPVALWKFSFEGWAVTEMFMPFVEMESNRSHHIVRDASNIIPYAVVGVHLNLKRRRSFLAGHLFCKAMIPLVSFAVFSCYCMFLGFDFMWYVNCQISAVGPSGNFQSGDTVCHIPASCAYQTVFIGIWFLLVCHMIIAMFALIIELIMLTSKKCRETAMSKLFPTESREVARKMSHTLDPAGFLVVITLIQNLHPGTAKQIARSLVRVVKATVQSKLVNV